MLKTTKNDFDQIWYRAWSRDTISTTNAQVQVVKGQDHGVKTKLLLSVRKSEVYTATVTGKLSYASSSWWDFTSASDDRQHVNGCIRRVASARATVYTCFRFRFCWHNRLSRRETVSVTDVKTFENNKNTLKIKKTFENVGKKHF